MKKVSSIQSLLVFVACVSVDTCRPANATQQVEECTPTGVAMRMMLPACALAAAALIGLQVCGALASPWSMLSTSTTIAGGIANGAIMGGSVIGVLRDAAEDSSAGTTASASARQQTVPVANDDT